MGEHAQVTIQPGMLSGTPTVAGHRIQAETIAGTVWSCGVKSTMDDFELTRCEVLTACWFVGTYGAIDWGIRGGKPILHRGEIWRKRWGSWAAHAQGPLWSGKPGECPDPPDVTTLTSPEESEGKCPDA
jgi:uncharacterized protein (DUF433 family)